MMKMSLRKIVWTITLLIVALPLAYMWIAVHRVDGLRERSEAYDAELRRHYEVIGSAREIALGKLIRIRMELAKDGLPSWAGEYSWSHRVLSWCAVSEKTPTAGEGFALAPEGGAVWWYGSEYPEDAGVLDYGRIVSVDADSIRVDWTVDSKEPHWRGLSVPLSLLSSELVRVHWDAHEFLVPSTRMAIFACGLHSNRIDELALAPRKGGWAPDHESLRSAIAADPVPVVPAAWRKCFQSEGIKAPARLESDPEIIFARRKDPDRDAPPPWWRWPPWQTFADCRDDLLRIRYEVSAGTDQGLVVGSPVFMQDDPSLPWGIVVEASRGSAHVEWWTWGIMFDPKDGPPEKVIVSTRAPKAR